MPQMLKTRRTRKPAITESQILEWADAFYRSHGQWPKMETPERAIPCAIGEKWRNVDNALKLGFRGLPGGSSLAHLLETHRGVRNKHNLPRLTLKQILDWADAFRLRTGRWPDKRDKHELIQDSQGERWINLEYAMMEGYRGLPSGWSLPRLLAARRSVRNIHDLPRLTIKQILTWADEYHEKTGRWPSCDDPSEIAGTNGEKWSNIDRCLRVGLRGLKGGSSLPKILAKYRSVGRSSKG